MKTIIFLTCSFFFVTQANAQARPDVYWVIETNKYQRDHSVIRFYDEEHNLIDEVRLNKRIDIQRKRHRHKLDKVVSRYTNRYVASRKH